MSYIIFFLILYFFWGKNKCVGKINAWFTVDIKNNKLSEGINDFINNNFFNNSELRIESSDNKLIFDYSDKCKIKFEYSVENKNKNNILKTLSFKGIKSLILNNFSNIDFLSNESLNNLIELNLRQNIIDDITIKFFN